MECRRTPERDRMRVVDEINRQDRIDEEAAGWVARLQSSDATEEDRREFAAWLALDPSHAAAYDELGRLWAELKEVPIPSGRLGRLKKARRRASAGLAILAVAFVAAFGAHRVGVVDRWQSDYYTVVGEVRTLRLEDGTRVDLNTDTAIAVRYSPAGRRIDLLRGEAFFDVAKAPGRPFVVDGGALTATALGTRYAVRTASGDAPASAQVAEGRVEVSAGQSRVLLEAGDVARLTERGGIGVARQDVGSDTAWREGKLVFSERPLGEVLDTLQRYRNGRIVVLDDAAARQSVSGIFDLADTDGALDALAASLPVSVTRITGMMVVVRSR